MLNFKQINTLTGWVVFVVATLVYVMTVEQTASFWDPGEFIAVSYKLQVPHPPGAPFFLLVYRMFSFLAFGNELNVAYWMNIGSAVFSGFTILFLFWSITLFGRKLLGILPGQESKGHIISLMGAGLVGSLIYTFSDSFWFSAVEAEVYAMSSFFTAIVIWAFLKWDVIKDPREENKWMIFIAYLVGLSIGVHLLNLVTLPALALIYYFKKYEKPNFKGGVIAFMLGGVALVIINNFIIPGLPSIAGSTEIFFVNSLGLPFGSGIIFFALAFFAALFYAYRYSRKKAMAGLNTILLSLIFILIGYSSYTMIVVRANQNPIINQNAPKDVISYISYLKREQYGYRPLIHGQYFTAQLVDQVEGDPIYRKGKDKYEIADYELQNTYDPEKTTILPRIYSTQENHKRIYRQKLGLREGQEPTFGDNLYFMFSHQLGHMYWRYFMWNFSGRESDFSDAPWIGLTDAFSDKFPEYIKENKAHNNYLMLPLLLGIIGLFFQAKVDPKSFAVNLMLFLMMGAVLVLYLNSPPVEPRERDYIYVGSFYAFAIWAGLGVLAIAHGLAKVTKNLATAGIAATLLTLPVAGLMGAENWNDHNRKGRYFSVDSARNFLASCAPNAILFTGGDNDTFPLWYVQEVEGFRTDVRVIVLSYFDTDWYVDQMTRPANESAALPFSLTPERYQKGTNDVLYVMERDGMDAISAREYLKLLNSGSELLRMRTGGKSQVNMVPSRNLILDVDSSTVAQKDIIPEEFMPLFTPQINLQVKGQYVTKGTLMLLDLIASNNWDRPIYFNNTSLATIGLNIQDHVVMEGLTYRLLPIRKPDFVREELVNTDLAYENYMTKFAFRGMDNPDTYLDEEYRRFASNHRSAINSIAIALLDEDDLERAANILNYGLKVMPNEAIPYDLSSGQSVPLFFEVGEEEKALDIIDKISKKSLDMIAYYTRENRDYDREMMISIEMVKYFIPLLEERGYQEKAQELKLRLEDFVGSESNQPGVLQRR
ncbi:MAG: glycosyltransferase family 117 protein [Bacteroidota bacterium]